MVRGPITKLLIVDDIDANLFALEQQRRINRISNSRKSIAPAHSAAQLLNSKLASTGLNGTGR